MSTPQRNPRVPSVHTAELVRRRSEVVVVDAHGASYFAVGHIPGAVNIPPHEVPRLAVRSLPDTDVPVVVYGSGRSSNAVIVADQLLGLGYTDVSLYEDGLEGWITAGLPTAVLDDVDEPPSQPD